MRIGCAGWEEEICDCWVELTGGRLGCCVTYPCFLSLASFSLSSLCVGYLLLQLIVMWLFNRVAFSQTPTTKLRSENYNIQPTSQIFICLTFFVPYSRNQLPNIHTSISRRKTTPSQQARAVSIGLILTTRSSCKKPQENAIAENKLRSKVLTATYNAQ